MQKANKQEPQQYHSCIILFITPYYVQSAAQLSK